MTDRIKNSQMNRKYKTPSIQKILTVLLGIFIILLAISLWSRSHPIEAHAPSPAIDENSTEETNSSEPLPSELTEPSSITVLVDKYHSLPADYVPSDLAEPYVNSTGEVIQVSAKAADSLKELINAANEAEIPIYLTGGYISYDTQEDYYLDRAKLVGEAEASKTTPKAGYSEHQTGLAVDFSNEPTGLGISASFAETDTGKWLYAHAHEYGFILRYPEGKESITGYSYFPWHYRYVGKDIASAMYEKSPDLTFEEYFNIAN